MMTTTTKISKLSYVLLTSALLVLTSIAAAQLVLVTTNNNNAVYGQPSPQCKPGFTFNRGVCEQAASSYLACPPTGVEDDSLEYVLEENEKGKLVCNLYETITEPTKTNEETGQPYCDPPFELIIREVPPGSDADNFCRDRHLLETVEPITVFECTNGGDLNTETNTCQMRPGRSGNGDVPEEEGG